MPATKAWSWNDLVKTLPDSDKPTRKKAIKKALEPASVEPTSAEIVPIRPVETAIETPIVAAETELVTPDLSRTGDRVPLINDIMAKYRRRNFYIATKNRQINSTGAYVRTVLGWNLELPEKERNAIAKKASDIVSVVEAGKGDEVDEELRFTIEDSKASRTRLEQALNGAWLSPDGTRHDKRQPGFSRLKGIESDIADLAAKTPGADFAENVRGLGHLALGKIIGESGDLSRYPNPAKLWKRMCVGVIGDRRQGDAGPKATKQDWVDHGYSKKRRSAMFVIVDTMLRVSLTSEKDADGEKTGNVTAQGRYAQIYLDRKAYETVKNEAGDYAEQAARCLSEKKPDKKTAAFKAYSVGKLPAGHINAQARRYVEKRLLKDLWMVWNGHTPEWMRA